MKRRIIALSAAVVIGLAGAMTAVHVAEAKANSVKANSVKVVGAKANSV